MVLIAAAMGLAAVRLLAIGAWPVAVFAVLDVALIYGAFRLSYRSGRQFEEIVVDENSVVFRKVSPAGKAVEHRFDPHWARLAITREEDRGVTRLDLGSHGRWVVVGDFLNPSDRESFAEAFANALRAARREP